jgi:hypothetical protein
MWNTAVSWSMKNFPLPKTRTPPGPENGDGMALAASAICCAFGLPGDIVSYYLKKKQNAMPIVVKSPCLSRRVIVFQLEISLWN